MSDVSTSDLENHVSSEKLPEKSSSYSQYASSDSLLTASEFDERELNFNQLPETPFLREKALEIERDLSKGVTCEVLKRHAKSEGGFVNDELRKKCWPLVLGLEIDERAGGENKTDDIAVKEHPEYHQVVLDVNRSLKRFPPGIPYNKRIALQHQLTKLIIRVITKYPHLRYYQGYHDVAVTFLLVVGEEVAFRIMEKLSTEHLRECMEPTMEKTSFLLNYIYPLLKRLNPELHSWMEKASVGTMFCLPWFLTWFGHNLNQYTDVVRLYDLFLATPPLTPLYLSATIVAHRATEILSVDCDMAAIHCLLSQIPDSLPFEKLIQDTLSLYKKCPPVSIEKEVIAMINKEKEERKREERERRRRREAAKGWKINQWIPRTMTSRVIIITLSIAVGIYAYFRADDPLAGIR